MEQGPLIFCPREDSFKEMFDVLGDESAQAAIREAQPDKVHCALLKQSPYFCAKTAIDVDGDFGFFPAGSVCPNNPYVKFADKIARQEATGQLVERAADVYRASHAGALSDAYPSIEITLAHVYGEWIDNKRNEQWQAKHLNSL